MCFTLSEVDSNNNSEAQFVEIYSYNSAVLYNAYSSQP